MSFRDYFRTAFKKTHAMGAAILDSEFRKLFRLSNLKLLMQPLRSLLTEDMYMVKYHNSH